MTDDILNSEEVTDEEESKQIPNIIVAGVTGAGKSTLINAVFGEELANTGTGKPVTDEMNEYKNDYICIWDTAGLEIDRKRTEKTIQEIKDKIVEKASKSKTDVIHAIWYCINVGSTRYQEAEIDFIKKLHNKKTPFFIVLTQSWNEDRSNEFEEKIKKINKENHLDDIEIIQVLAKDYPVKINRQRFTVEQRGLKELVDKTSNNLTLYIRDGFIAAQQIDIEAKRKLAIEKLGFYCDEFKNNFWGKVWFIKAFITNAKTIDMIRDVSNIYNTKFSREQLRKIIDKSGLITDPRLKTAFDDLKKEILNSIPYLIDYFKGAILSKSSFDWKKILICTIVEPTCNFIKDGITRTNSLSPLDNLEWFCGAKSREKEKMEDLKKSMEKETNDELLNSVNSILPKYDKDFEILFLFSIGIAFINAIEDFWKNDYTQSEVNKIDIVSKKFAERLKELKNRLNKNKKSEDENL